MVKVKVSYRLDSEVIDIIKDNAGRDGADFIGSAVRMYVLPKSDKAEPKKVEDRKFLEEVTVKY